MGYAWQKFGNSIASGITLTGAYDVGRAYNRVYLEVPTMLSGTDFFIQGSPDNSTFRRIQIGSPQFLYQKITMPIATTLSSGFDLGDGAFNPILYLSTFTTGTSVLVKVSHDNTTFERLIPQEIATSAVQAVADYSISTMAASTGRFYAMPGGYRYFKVEFATGCSAVVPMAMMFTRPHGATDFQISSLNTNRIVPIPGQFRYYKVELSTAMTDTTSTFNFLCGGE